MGKSTHGLLFAGHSVPCILRVLTVGDEALPRTEPLYQRALIIMDKTLGPEHPNVAVSLHNLAGLYGVMGDHTRAEPLLDRSLAVAEKALGPEHPALSQFLSDVAELYVTKALTLAPSRRISGRSIAEKTLGYTRAASTCSDP